MSVHWQLALASAVATGLTLASEADSETEISDASINNVNNRSDFSCWQSLDLHSLQPKANFENGRHSVPALLEIGQSSVSATSVICEGPRAGIGTGRCQVLELVRGFCLGALSLASSEW